MTACSQPIHSCIYHTQTHALTSGAPTDLTTHPSISIHSLTTHQPFHSFTLSFPAHLYSHASLPNLIFAQNLRPNKVREASDLELARRKAWGHLIPSHLLANKPLAPQVVPYQNDFEHFILPFFTRQIICIYPS